ALAAGLGGDGDEELAEPGPLSPRFADMLVQGVGPVLGEDVDPLDPRVEQVAQDKVDDLVFAAEGDTRFGAAHGEGTEPLPFAAGQNHGDSVSPDIIVGVHRVLPVVAAEPVIL